VASCALTIDAGHIMRRQKGQILIASTSNSRHGEAMRGGSGDTHYVTGRKAPSELLLLRPFFLTNSKSYG